jgi:hypothetical protein
LFFAYWNKGSDLREITRKVCEKKNVFGMRGMERVVEVAGIDSRGQESEVRSQGSRVRGQEAGERCGGRRLLCFERGLGGRGNDGIGTYRAVHFEFASGALQFDNVIGLKPRGDETEGSGTRFDVILVPVLEGAFEIGAG